MKIKITLLIMMICNLGYTQVGINTLEPSTSLDINGNLRVRTLALTTSHTISRDSILVATGNGTVNRVSSKTIINSTLKTTVKGVFSSSSLVNLTFLSGTIKIPFNSIDFDTNTEFNTTTNTFTAQQDGIYRITAQIKANNTIAIATNFGLAALKNGTIFAKNSFANAGVLGVNITPPIRTINTLISLNTNDTITFNLVSDLASVSILGNSEDSFFTIEQIR